MRTTLSTLSLAVSMSAVLALAACHRDEATPAAPSAATNAPAPAASIVEPAIVEPAVAATIADPVGVSEAAAPGEHTTFDAKAFAGTYADDNVSIAFAADGTYTRSSHAADDSPGTWTLEADGHSLRLDPNAKGEADRVYTLAADGALQAANGTQVLRRAGGTR